MHAIPLVHTSLRTESPRLTATAPETPAARTPDFAPASRSRESTPSPPLTGASRRVHFPLEVEPAATAIPQEHDKPPRSPVTPIKHARIPSTGNRATVMDVAQALSEHEEKFRKGTEDDALVASSVVEQVAETSETAPKLDVKSMVSNWGAGNGNATPTSSDKRKSSYEKYSAFVMPPLVEEKTPAASPANTLARHPDVLTALKDEIAAPSVKSPKPLEQPAVDAHPELVEAAPASPRIAELKSDMRAVDPYIHFGKLSSPVGQRAIS